MYCFTNNTVVCDGGHRVATGLFFLSAVPPLVLVGTAVAGGPCWEEGGGTDCFFTSRRVIWGRGGGLSPDLVPQYVQWLSFMQVTYSPIWRGVEHSISYFGCQPCRLYVQYAQYAAAYTRTLIAVQFMCYGLPL